MIFKKALLSHGLATSVAKSQFIVLEIANHKDTMKRLLKLSKVGLFFSLFLNDSVVLPQDNKNKIPQKTSSLNVLRFVVLRSSKVNLHVGPGANFPVSWLYIKKSLPVEVIAEFDTWRQIRDFQGTEGWVHKSLLSGSRHGIVMHQTQTIRKAPDLNAKIIGYVEKNVICRLKECNGQWCYVEVKESQNEEASKLHKGWLPQNAIWGIYLHETKM